MSEGKKEHQRFNFIPRSIIVLGYLILFAVFLYVPAYIVDGIFADHTLNVCAFTETFSPEALSRFEKLMGIKVNMTYVELDEQIYAKFKINEGAGYDVINVSDFMAQMLANSDMLLKLDYAKIPNKSLLNPYLLDRAYDPGNQFSVPHKWFMYGLVYNKNFFKCSPDAMSLSYIFKDPAELSRIGLVSHPYKVCMIDSPLDAFFLASLYNLSSDGSITLEDLPGLTASLIKQKQWTECYTLYSTEYFLLTDIVPIAMTSSNFMRKIWDESKRFDFAIPQEGGILVVENLVVPKHSKRPAMAQAFIDFMLSDEIAELNSSEYRWSSANMSANAALDHEYKQLKHLFLNAEITQRLHIPLFSASMRKEINEFWLHVGFA